MRLSSKGRITIPLELRRKLGLDPDAEVDLEVVDNALRLRRVAAPGLVRDLVAKMRGTATSGKRTDQILKHTRR